MSERHEYKFKTETQQLLDLMIHSIYTHKEIFLRELISNASDALDKIKFESLTKPEILKGIDDLYIEIKPDKKARTLLIRDNGIGMTFDELRNNIGVIASSGTRKFIESLKNANKNNQQSENNTNDLNNTIDLIGKFGVGFYSAFMVSNKVVILTKSPLSDKGYRWESKGDGKYTIEEYDKYSNGTDVILFLKENDDEENYDRFLEEFEIEQLVKKYSDFIPYPIKIEDKAEEEGEKEDPKVIKKKKYKILNSQKPLWQKSPDEIKEESYNVFYKQTFHDFDDPFITIHTKGEGLVDFKALIFIPKQTGIEIFSPQYKKGLKLYSKNVFIMEQCEELVPDYLKFIKGVVDSPDFSLNISREILQHTKILKTIQKHIEKKVINSLAEKLKNKREEYEKWWKYFGKLIKTGVYTDFAKENTKLHQLLIFPSSFNNSANKSNYTTLDEYISRMKEGQEFIYYLSGEDIVTLQNAPQMEFAKEKGYEVLFLIDEVDELMIQSLLEYKGKKFKSLAKSEGNKISDEIKKATSENKKYLDKIKEILTGKVKDVVLTDKLKQYPACISTSENSLSIHMEKILSNFEAMPGIKAEKVLEINPEHTIFKKFKVIYDSNNNAEELKEISNLLYDYSLLSEGIMPENISEFTKIMNKIMEKAF